MIIQRLQFVTHLLDSNLLQVLLRELQEPLQVDLVLLELGHVLAQGHGQQQVVQLGIFLEDGRVGFVGGVVALLALEGGLPLRESLDDVLQGGVAGVACQLRCDQTWGI